MSYLYATLMLAAAMSFVLWPLIRHQDPHLEVRPAAPSPRDEMEQAIEEVELDRATGRLSAEEASRRVAEIRSSSPGNRR